MDTFKFLILGGGGRGQMFSEWLANEYGAGCVVGVAEPSPTRRAIVAEQHGIPKARCYETWQDALAQPRFADIVLNTTLDQDHIGSAVKAMESGYHMLLEKPMAVNIEDCEKIDQVRQETGRIVSVCHSLRYHAGFAEVRKILRSGIIGEIVSYDQLEAVEHIHMSHSFVRGNWAREADSTFLLMAKSCHDIDILVDMVGDDVESLSSFGSLSYFKPANAPVGAPKFCLEGCPHSVACPYDAAKLYLSDGPWANYAGFTKMSRSQAQDALKVSDYGRCVFKAGNDAVDHQVVALNFRGGATATLTVTAFTPFGGRFLRVHGTKGYLEAKIDEGKITYWQFWEENLKTTVEIPPASGAHGGADAIVMKTLIRAVQENNPGIIPTDTAASLKTHSVVFHAEMARRENRVVHIHESIPYDAVPVG